MTLLPPHVILPFAHHPSDPPARPLPPLLSPSQSSRLPSYVSPQFCTRTHTHLTRANPFSPAKTTTERFDPSFRISRRAAMYEPADVARTYEILARFRPIAPKPQLSSATHIPAPVLQFCNRSSRTRKRCRAAPSAPAKRKKTTNLSPSSTLPFPPPHLQPMPATPPLVERDLLQNLQAPKIIAPRPVRPIGSSISVGPISEGSNGSPPPPAPKSPDEVEDEVESETLPAVVSDHNNRVRMANSAYKELVGQPECMWLDSMGSGSGRRGFKLRPPSRRINGEVMLDFSGGSTRPPASSEGFSCRVKIEWACNGRRTFIDAPCDVIRVYCESKDYLFAWRFHIAEALRTDSVS